MYLFSLGICTGYRICHAFGILCCTFWESMLKLYDRYVDYETMFRQDD